MNYPTNGPDEAFSGSPKPSVWKRLKGLLGKRFFVLVYIAFLLILILSLASAGNKDDQKVSEDFKDALVTKGSMKNSIFLNEVEKTNDKDAEAVTPQEKEVVAKEEEVKNPPPEESQPEEKIVEDIPQDVPTVKKEPTKKTATVKTPLLPAKKAKSKAISCKHENDKPKYSKTKGKHMDEDCCPDPDEWPKPGCVYSEKGLGLMLSGPPKKKK